MARGQRLQRLPLAARVLRAVMRSRVRGSTRLSALLASFVPSLHSVPIQVATGQLLFLDMRAPWCRDLLGRPALEGPAYWEPDEQQVIGRLVRPGEVAFDIGANFGQHCPLLADLVGPHGRLVAFEPDPAHRAALTRTVTQRGNGSLLPYALGDRTGEGSFFMPDDHTMASLANWTGREATEIRCELVTLDTLVERGVVPLPDFIKCDVEGAELQVFRGARRTLDRTDAPILLYEANADASAAFGDRLEDSTRFLATLTSPRYAVSWVRPGGRLEPLHAFPSDVGLFNLVAVPASKLDRVT